MLMDAGQMQQVFLNLLINAGEAMPSGGSLTIITRSAPPGRRRRRRRRDDRRSAPAEGQVAGEADKVQIVFRDTGTGIPPENLSKIFDPFFTSKDVGHGTGLGLAVSYGIIEQHGGTIDVESTLGAGTTFTILLPVAGGRMPATRRVNRRKRK